ncbi:unnamed protein product [Cuscuta campestris]|uniref:Cupin type-1 domain-containing protein n=1 Tax=Cuscuta campestris TaxID=132261 RepID=A0A484NAB9_9ASTE|nr:unnamed protein product [Cuscuta campestris]
MMGKKKQIIHLLLLSLLLLLGGSAAAAGTGGGGGRNKDKEAEFMLREEEEAARTEAGVIRVVRGGGGGGEKKAMDIGFITMEPKSLLLPHFLDSHLVLFLPLGEARIGHVYKDELVEKELKSGDIYTIEAGSAFYLVNTAEGQRLRVICSIVRGSDHSLPSPSFQPYFIGGGAHPTSVLSGFDFKTLSTAFNVSGTDLTKLLRANLSGPIVPLSKHSQSSDAWDCFMNLKQEERLARLKRFAGVGREDDDNERSWRWAFKKALVMTKMMLGPFSNKEESGSNKEESGSGEASESYNIFEAEPDFSNDYGWSLAVGGDDYSSLKLPDITVYLVNLSAGSMMAPHINPRASEYGVVLRGTGEVQIVFPNGTLAMKAQVEEGDVFLVPRFFPFCQIASRNGPFVFFGFTTSARDNGPQFLAGQGSVLQLLKGRELATALGGLSKEKLDSILEAQSESTILPPATASPSVQQVLKMI